MSPLTAMEAVKFSRITAPDLGLASAKGGASKPGAFADLVKDGIERLTALEHDADEQTRKLLAGEPVELHRVVLAGEQASLAFELMMSIRNKAVEAYQEVMRMQV